MSANTDDACTVCDAEHDPGCERCGFLAYDIEDGLCDQCCGQDIP